MGKRICSAVLFLVTLGLTIWQTLSTGNAIAIVVLGTACIGSFLFTVFPFLRWGVYMIKFLLKMWRTPGEGLFLSNPTVSFVPTPSELGTPPSWSCGFDIISTIPWSKKVFIDLEIRDAEKITGTKGQLEIMVLPLCKTTVNSRPFDITSQVAEYLKEKIIGKEPGFLSLRILVNVRDIKHKNMVTGYSMNYTYRYN